MSTVPLRTIDVYDGPKKEGSYIVLLKTDADKAVFLQHARDNYSDIEVTADWDPNFINGFVVTSGDAGLNFLRSHADVLSIEEDGEFSTCRTLTQEDACWGLARLCQDDHLHGSSTDLNWKYKFEEVDDKVDIYIVDTGIRTTHKDFGGRARWGKTFGKYKDADGNGHGTHVAGIAAGHRWGVAKSAQLIAVKAMSDKGSGLVSDIISGLNYVASQAALSTDRAAVVNMSIGGGKSNSMDTAVTKLVSEGITVVVAAGNSGHDANENSPARCEAAITVGASEIKDSRVYWSNYGSALNCFAPGVTITSASIKSDTASVIMSGTSMASPAVAGLSAYLIARSGKQMQPADVKTLISEYGVRDKLSNIPSGTLNLLVRNDQ